MTNRDILSHMPNDRQLRVLDAAQALFARHGFRRVTMGDIAREIGWSRPALYLVFANKEEIFRSVVLRYCADSLAEIRRRTAEAGSLAERLEVATEVWFVEPFRLTAQAPDAKELVDAGHSVASDIIEGAFRRFERLLATFFGDEAARLRELNVTPLEFARLFSAAGRGMRYAASDVRGLRRMLRAMIVTVLAAVDRRAPTRGER